MACGVHILALILQPWTARRRYLTMASLMTRGVFVTAYRLF
jgi:hypothetical protein